MPTRMNRRTFSAALGAGLLAATGIPRATAATLTAGEAIERVKKKLADGGVTWQERPAGPGGPQPADRRYLQDR